MYRVCDRFEKPLIIVSFKGSVIVEDFVLSLFST